MAFVDDDQIKKILGKLIVYVARLLGAVTPVEAEVNFVGLVDGAFGNLGHGLTKGFEVVGLGLVGEDIAVNEKEDAFLGTGFPQPPDDLEGGVGLSGSGGHHEEESVFAPGIASTVLLMALS